MYNMYLYCIQKSFTTPNLKCRTQKLTYNLLSKGIFYILHKIQTFIYITYKNAHNKSAKKYVKSFLRLKKLITERLTVI